MQRAGQPAARIRCRRAERQQQRAGTTPVGRGGQHERSIPGQHGPDHLVVDGEAVEAGPVRSVEAVRREEAVATVVDDADRRPLDPEEGGRGLHEACGQSLGVARNREETALEIQELLQPEDIERGRVGCCECRGPDTFLLLHGERWM